MFLSVSPKGLSFAYTIGLFCVYNRSLSVVISQRTCGLGFADVHALFLADFLALLVADCHALLFPDSVDGIMNSVRFVPTYVGTR